MFFQQGRRKLLHFHRFSCLATLLFSVTKHHPSHFHPLTLATAFIHPSRMQTMWYTGRKDHAARLDDPFLEATKRKGKPENDEDKKAFRDVKRTRRRRINRPGYNSYLKVVLDDSTMNTLHQMATEIQKRLTVIDVAEKDSLDVEVEGNQDGDASTKKQAKPLRFKPRSRQSLHMTFFFGGETLCGLPSQELLQFHQRITTRLAQSGFKLFDHSGTNDDDKNNKQEDNDKNDDEDYSFYVKGLKVFPPRRNNLVVAILEPTTPKLWNDLYKDIRQVAQEESCSQKLAEITKFSKPEWVAHVTLGNLYGGTKSKVKSLDNDLNDAVFYEVSTKQQLLENSTTVGSSSHGDYKKDSPTDFQAYVSSISMGGPIPEQIELDWEFHFHQM